MPKKMFTQSNMLWIGAKLNLFCLSISIWSCNMGLQRQLKVSLRGRDEVAAFIFEQVDSHRWKEEELQQGRVFFLSFLINSLALRVTAWSPFGLSADLHQEGDGNFTICFSFHCGCLHRKKIIYCKKKCLECKLQLSEQGNKYTHDD